MAHKDDHDELDVYLDDALKTEQREKMAMDRLDDFLEGAPELESARKTWLRSLFATVMMMGNFSIALKDREQPKGLPRSDGEEDQLPGGSG